MLPFCATKHPHCVLFDISVTFYGKRFYHLFNGKRVKPFFLLNLYKMYNQCLRSSPPLTVIN